MSDKIIMKLATTGSNLNAKVYEYPEELSGGRNLFTGTSFDTPSIWASNDGEVTLITERIESIEAGVLDFKNNRGLSKVHVGNLGQLTNHLKEGTNVFRLQGYFKRMNPNTRLEFQITNTQPTARVVYSGSYPITSDDYEYFEIDITFNVTNVESVTSSTFYFTSTSADAHARYALVKLEKGNKATDWTPAPEDMVDRYSNQTIGGMKIFTGDRFTVDSRRILLGKDTSIEGTDGIVIGKDSMVTANGGIAIGNESGAGSDGVSIGTWSYAENGGVAIGKEAYADALNSFAIGNGAEASRANQGALGSSTTKWTMPGSLAIGKTTEATEKLDVSGNIKASGTLITPKVSFGNGFTLEASGTQLVMKYNGVIKQRFLSDGSIASTNELSAHQ